MEVSDARLRPGKPAPPPAPARRARNGARRRAKLAVRILEKHGHVTDRQHYQTRPSAIGMARRLVEAIEEYEGMPRAELRRRVWLENAGWRWQISRKQQRG